MQKFTFWWKGFWSWLGRKLILIPCHLFFSLFIQPHCASYLLSVIFTSQSQSLRGKSFIFLPISKDKKRKNIPLSYCLLDRILVLWVHSCAIHHPPKLCSNSNYAHEGWYVERLPFFMPSKAACCDLTSFSSHSGFREPYLLIAYSKTCLFDFARALFLRGHISGNRCGSPIPTLCKREK